MFSKQQFITCTGIILFIGLGIAATRLSHKNLKVLPQDITEEKLDSIMHAYNRALGVKCDFCHSSNTKIEDGLNFPSDGNPMKDEARKMMRLTIQLNKDYFYFDSTKQPEYLNVVSCITCHRGDPMPVDLK